MRNLIPLGDQAVLASFSNELDAHLFAESVRRASFPWTVDVVQSYSTAAVFYDAASIRYREAADVLDSIDAISEECSARLIEIPCCYERQLDLDRVARLTDLSGEEVVARHAGTVYRVHAIGFCPGFPYLGKLPDSISGVPRLDSPRLKVEAGSVGMTGKQTGIYTQSRPGGWNIIGRTPLELVNVEDEYFPLRTGDRIRFVRIDETEFRRLEGRRLDSSEEFRGSTP